MRAVNCAEAYLTERVRYTVCKLNYTSPKASDLILLSVVSVLCEYISPPVLRIVDNAFSLVAIMASPSGRVHKVNTGIVTSCVVGLALSYYAWVVEVAKEQDDSYEAMCDISENISCTKAFMSEYGKGFGLIPRDSFFCVPNSIYGLIFYSILAITSVFNRYYHAVTLVFLSTLSNVTSIYLAWILYVLGDICIVCVSTYAVNAIVLILAIRKLRIVSHPVVVSSAKRKKQ